MFPFLPFDPFSAFSAAAQNVGQQMGVQVAPMGVPPPRARRPGPRPPRFSADAPKADAPKADAPKADAPKADAPKADAPKADAPKKFELGPTGEKVAKGLGMGAGALGALILLRKVL